MNYTESHKQLESRVTKLEDGMIILAQSIDALARITKHNSDDVTARFDALVDLIAKKRKR